MKIAVVGAGLAGLALAYHLKQINQDFDISLFDTPSLKKASDIESGLVHPLVSDGSRFCFEGKKALQSTLRLIDAVEKFSGKTVSLKEPIVKLAWTNREKQNLSLLARKHEGLCYDSTNKKFGQLFISCARTIFVKDYLFFLKSLCLNLGVNFIEKVVTPSELESSYDLVILAMGANVVNYPEITQNLPLQVLKGQTLKVKIQRQLPYSTISKGYIAKTKNPNEYFLGSTYERFFDTDQEDIELAKRQILIKLSNILETDQVDVLSCFSAVRVCNKQRHLPIISQIAEKTVVVTALGSRGILYHSFIAEQIALAAKTRRFAIIKKEFIS